MLSLRNGTAMAIILSIAFVLVAVAGRDQIPGFANDNGNSATSTANELVGTESPGGTAAEMQIGSSDGAGIGSTELTQSAAWDDDYDDYDDDDEYDDDDDHHDDDDDDHEGGDDHDDDHDDD
jgi:hypothetical protein